MTKTPFSGAQWTWAALGCHCAVCGTRIQKNEADILRCACEPTLAQLAAEVTAWEIDDKP